MCVQTHTTDPYFAVVTRRFAAVSTISNDEVYGDESYKELHTFIATFEFFCVAATEIYAPPPRPPSSPPPPKSPRSVPPPPKSRNISSASAPPPPTPDTRAVKYYYQISSQSAAAFKAGRSYSSTAALH